MSGEERIYTAAAIIIGNEVLSGRVDDANLVYLARGLKADGIRLLEARVIPDVADVVVDTINTLRTRHDYVFTTGGIGPTHDDITAQCVADAFGVPLERHPEAMQLLQEHYDGELNDARLRMASIPRGGVLLENPVSRAPGFRVGNVYVLPGVPFIMQAIFDGLRPRLAGGRPQLSRTVTAAVGESAVAAGLAAIEERFADAEIGSYPFMRGKRYGTALVVRSIEPQALAAATEEVAALVRSLGVEPQIDDGEGPPDP